MKTRKLSIDGFDATRIRALLLAALLGLAMPMALSGCNTTEGVGRDIQDAGEGIEDIAR